MQKNKQFLVTERAYIDYTITRKLILNPKGRKMKLHSDLKPGNKFPNFELPDQTGEVLKLTQRMRGWPSILVFYRGVWWPKCRLQLENYVRDLQPELPVNYCKLYVVTVDDAETTRNFQNDLGAAFPFLIDADRTLITKLDIVDNTDAKHPRIPIPYTFVLDRNREIYKIYNGWWFVGRPTVEELRMDLRALMSRRDDYAYDRAWDEEQ